MNVGILEGISTGIRVPVCASYFIPVGDLPQSEKEAVSLIENIELSNQQNNKPYWVLKS